MQAHREMTARSRYRLVACLSALAAAGCETRLQQVSLTRDKMSTLVTITVFDRSRPHAQLAIEAAFEQIDAVTRLADRRRPESEVRRLTQSTQPMRVSPHLWRLLTAAKAMSERTGGAFDVTVGPPCILWKRCAQQKRLPSDQEIKQALDKVGADGILLDETGRTAALSRPGMVVDLGAIAKGYAVDQAVAALQAHGVVSALVNAGGDMRMIGPRPGAKGWRIGVQDPRDPHNPSALLRTLQVQACAVATSGSYQRFFEIDGKTYSHIIDPRTARPCAQAPSVTVVSKTDAMTADMWATAASVLDPSESLRLIDAEPDLEALLVTAGPKGRLNLLASKGFDALEAKP